MSEQEEFEFRARLEAEQQANKTARAPATGFERVKAGAAGINKGVLNDLLGLPVDTVTNVLDLAKAGIGYGYSKATGNQPPGWTVPYDRQQVPGSAEWLSRKANDIGLGAAVNNPHPEDQASRILHTGGRVAGASVFPSGRLSLPQQVVNMGKGAASGLAAGSVGEVAPEWAGVAGLLPQAVTAAGAAALRAAVNQPKMAQRIKDLKAGGVDNPSLGLASGNKFISGLENLLSQTPGSVGLYDRARQANVEGMQAKTGAIRDAVSTDYGPVAAGAAVQADLKTAFPNRINQTARALNDKVANLVGHDTVVPVDNTLGKTRQLTTPIRGAEATSGDLVLPRIAKIGENLRTDVYGPRANPAPTLNADNPTLHAALTPEVPQLPVGNSSLWNVPVEPTVPMAQMATTPPPRAPVVLDSLTNLPKKSAALPPLPQRTGPNPTLNLPLSAAVPQQPVANPYVWNVPVAPRIPLPQRSTGPTAPGTPFSSLMNAQKNPGLPYGALKALRTSIGEEAASNAIIGTPEQGQFKQLYGAMSQDMRHAADASDRTRAQVPTGPMRPSDQPATRALSRANRYYSNAMDQVEALNGLANRPTPEGAYGAVANSLKAGPSIYQRLRNAVTPETRQKVAATVIDELGSATPGQQNADGTAWSPRTFLTNYNRIDPQARTELFKRLPGGADHAENLAHVAKAADMLSEGAGVWANPSGTSQALVARGALGTIGAGVVGGLFYTPLIAPAAVAGGSLLLANQVSQRLLLNPKFVNWLAKAPPVKTPQQAAAYAQRLMMAAKMTNDPQFSQDASAYLEQAGLVPDASITPLDQLPRKQGAK